MRKLLVASVVVALGWTTVSLSGSAQDAKKPTIKEVMQVCMKGGLCGKVANGNASEEEKKKLAEMFAALHANTPPRGDEASWKEKTKALVDAANDVLAGKEGATDALKKAANCMGCHSAHKGK
jgi:surface antigen